MAIGKRIITQSTKDLNKKAIEMCENGRKTLIFTAKTKFVPIIQYICSRRDSIFFTESDLYFDVITKKFDEFDQFILVNKDLNDFDQEFFRQLQFKNRKKIIQLVPESHP